MDEQDTCPCSVTSIMQQAEGGDALVAIAIDGNYLTAYIICP